MLTRTPCGPAELRYPLDGGSTLLQVLGIPSIESASGEDREGSGGGLSWARPGSGAHNLHPEPSCPATFNCEDGEKRPGSQETMFGDQLASLCPI